MRTANNIKISYESRNIIIVVFRYLLVKNRYERQSIMLAGSLEPRENVEM